MMSSASSVSALKHLRQGSLNWNPALEKQAQELSALLAQKDPQELADELQRQLRERFATLSENIQAVNSLHYERQLTPPTTIWQEGSSLLYDYGGTGTKILFVPSLINRSYILDISEQRSFLRYLAGQNLHPYLIDWTEVTDDELDLGLDDYITRLNKAIEHVASKNDEPVILAGYCMGGLLALAASMHTQDRLAGMAFMATPWDYHCNDFPRITMNEQTTDLLKNIIGMSDKVSASVVQSIFYYLHPDMINHKFQTFMSLDAEEMEESLALEYWVNDGISMTKNVWEACFIGWAQHNHPATGQWQVLGKKVDPTVLTLPTFFALPTRDRIVPPPCSAPLTQYFSNPYIHRPNTGHVGMVAGPKARKQLWQPFEAWVKELS